MSRSFGRLCFIRLEFQIYSIIEFPVFKLGQTTLIIIATGSSFSGRSGGGSCLEQRRDVLLLYFHVLRIVWSCSRAMSGIVSFVIEHHRSSAPVEKETHKGVSELKEHLIELLGLKEHLSICTFNSKRRLLLALEVAPKRFRNPLNLWKH